METEGKNFFVSVANFNFNCQLLTSARAPIVDALAIVELTIHEMICMLFSDFETAVAVHFHTERIDGASVTLSISAGEIHICK
jgi:hypothetical protein